MAKLWKILCLLALSLSPLRAELQVDITRGSINPMPIAILNFEGESGKSSALGDELTRVIAADLERSGLFKPMDSRSFIQRHIPLNVHPRFGDWRLIHAQALLHGAVQETADGQVHAKFRLWDTLSEKQLVGLSFTGSKKGWRRIAHKIADEVYKRITGESGYFDTRAVYVSEKGPLNKRVTRLAIMDQDGENHRFLTNGQYLVLTPRFSPTAQEVTYLSYVNKQPRVYLLNLETGKNQMVGHFPGMTFAPRFSPDGKTLIFSQSIDGNSSIFTYDLRNRKITRLTQGAWIDTSPCFSPDGQKIVFNSDRGGKPQLYVMNKDGSNPQRISFGDGKYTTPVWSPRGDQIAFTKILPGGVFYIGVMRVDGSGERLVTKGFLVEGPTWSPNGRVLMYTRGTPMTKEGKGGHSKVNTIDLTGYNEREVITPVDASGPAWSPLLP